MKVGLKQTLKDITDDIPQNNKTLKIVLSNYFYNQGFRVLLNYRIGKYFYFNNFFLMRQIGHYYSKKLILKRNCDISYYAKIGSNVRLPHPIGIVIGKGVIIEDGVKIWQHVTLGSHGKKNKESAYPIICKNVKIYPNVILIGGIKIGQEAIIGAGSVVNINVPAYSTAVGIPCKIIK